MKTNYTCKGCMACEQSPTGFICSFENGNIDLNFDVSIKRPCFKFIPEQYIRSINYDTN